MKRLAWGLLILALVGCEQRYDVDYLPLASSVAPEGVAAPEGEFVVPFLGEAGQSRLTLAVTLDELKTGTDWSPWVTAGFTSIDKLRQVKAFVAAPDRDSETLSGGYQLIEAGKIQKQVTLITGEPGSRTMQVQLVRGAGGAVYIRVGDREARVTLPTGEPLFPVVLVASATASLRWQAD